jgi:hypothetical protein
MKAAVLCLFLAAVALSGCNNAPTTSEDSTAGAEQHAHDHDHELPQSYAAAVAEIKSCRDEVKSAFDAGTPDACDHALHTAADVLDALGGLAGKAGLGKEDVEAVNSAAKELFGLFSEIHHGFHGDGEGAAFDDVADKINEAIATLESKVSLDDVTHDDHDAHDHDAHDHDAHDHDGGDLDHDHDTVDDHGDEDHNGADQN